jgi:hypothetical protein
MGRRTRKKRTPAIEGGYARGEERNERIREELEPLAPGERPGAVTVGAIVALVFALLNVLAILLGRTIDDDATTSSVAFSVILVVAAAGMWKAKYWAVLGFQALLGIAIVFSALSLMVASNLAAVALCLGIVAIAGPLFWFLIRAMARIQLPSRRPQDPVG